MLYNKQIHLQSRQPSEMILSNLKLLVETERPVLKNGHRFKGSIKDNHITTSFCTSGEFDRKVLFKAEGDIIEEEKGTKITLNFAPPKYALILFLFALALFTPLAIFGLVLPQSQLGLVGQISWIPLATTLISPLLYWVYLNIKMEFALTTLLHVTNAMEINQETTLKKVA